MAASVAQIITRTLVLVPINLVGTEFAMAQAQKHIRRGVLEELFTQVREDSPEWDVDGPMLWGYFFFDSSRDRLQLAAAELSSQGYRIVDVELVDEDSGQHRLHVEKIETHSPESLDSRNREFEALAIRLGIAAYDGMDVGPAQPESSK